MGDRSICCIISNNSQFLRAMDQHYLRCNSNVLWRLMSYPSMVNINVPHRPSIVYRPIKPSDLGVLEKTHGELFPIRQKKTPFQLKMLGSIFVGVRGGGVNRFGLLNGGGYMGAFRRMTAGGRGKHLPVPVVHYWGISDGMAKIYRMISGKLSKYKLLEDLKSSSEEGLIIAKGKKSGT